MNSLAMTTGDFPEVRVLGRSRTATFSSAPVVMNGVDFTGFTVLVVDSAEYKLPSGP